MSWLSETFGDSLNSIKGQITKIKKEVLAEDFDENEDENESVKMRIKELGSLCSSKDSEIASLQDENQKITQRFQEELKLLRNENKKLRENFKRNNRENILLSDDQIQQVCELEDQLQQLKIERDHLEELQKDHQSNICLIIQQRDNYKHELEKLKQSFYDLQLEKKEILENQSDTSVSNNLKDINLSEIQVKNEEMINLRNIVEKLQIQIESYQNEKEETTRVIESHMLNSEGSKEKIEKLLEEIKILNSEKENAELENQKMRDAIISIKSDFSDKVEKLETEQKHRCELEENLIKLSHMLETNKNEQLSFNTNIANKLKNLVKVFNINIDEKNIDDKSYNKIFDLIEQVWTNNLKDREDIESLHNQMIGKLQNEVQQLKDIISNQESEIKIKNNEINEMEINYKEEIDSLQSKYLELKSQEQDSNMESHINDVKKLNQEISKLMEVIETKNIELAENYSKVNEITQELSEVKNVLKNSQDELLSSVGEKEKCDDEILRLKNKLDAQQREISEILAVKKEIEEKCKNYEKENAKILQENNSLSHQLNESTKRQKNLEDDIQDLRNVAKRAGNLEEELSETAKSKTELEKTCSELQQVQLHYKNQIEHLKAEIIIKETNLTELKGQHQLMKNDFNKMQEKVSNLKTVEEELSKWKESMVDLEIQREDLLEQSQVLENECAQLKIQLLEAKKKEEEIEKLRRDNANIMESYNKLLNESRISAFPEVKNAEETAESESKNKINELNSFNREQENAIAILSCENNELKRQIQIAHETITALKEENARLKENGNKIVPEEAKRIISVKEKINEVHQHRRCKSDADFDNAGGINSAELAEELGRLKQLSLQQLNDYKVLQEQYGKITEKEAHSRKELERLRLHLIEIESDYTETIDEYKTKLNAAEEQLKNSSTFYTSTKVRDNQHLESLQSQLRLMSVQRDDLQAKLSAAEDEVQKHKAALTSFHVVLEQFQQDKEREMESVVTKYEHQLLMTEKRFAELQQEMNSLSSQLSEAKNGLKAASRLGEQLERKSQQIIEQEKELATMKRETLELQERSAMANQSNFNKIDKSLIKNLLIGYLTAQQADRKAQVLRIMGSVLDFDQEERNKLEIDGSQTSGWLSTLLHPKSDGAQPSQSLSEAFIRFLENESRPQPQLKLLPERSSQGEKCRSTNATPKPSLLLQELVLPTFNSPQSSESTILKDVLKES